LDVIIPVTSSNGTELGADVFVNDVDIIITHTWDGDLEITLESPNGVMVDLSLDNGSLGDNYGDTTDCPNNTTNFNMSAAMSISDGSAPFIGSYMPEGNFADFSDGSSADGDWILHVCDDLGGDVGTIEYVSMSLGDISSDFEGSCGDSISIPDNTCPTGATALISVVAASGSSLGTDIELSDVDITIEHTWAGDLDISLMSPNGVVVDLTLGNGGSGDNFGVPSACPDSTTNFNMDAGMDITSVISGDAPFVGSYVPEGDFNDFNDGSDPNGFWTLMVCDGANGDLGTIEHVSLSFGLPECPQPTSVAVAPGITDAMVSWDLEPLVVEGTQIQYRIPPAIAGVSAASTVIGGAGTTSKMISGIDANQQYQMRIRHFCGALGSSTFKFKPFMTLPLRYQQTATDIVMYPNPAGDVVNLQIATGDSKEQNVTVEITNILGQSMIQWAGGVTGSEVHQIDVRLLAAGQYLVKVAINEFVETHKLVILK
jgi:subtilisin-like proprotein convertase family protein